MSDLKIFRKSGLKIAAEDNVAVVLTNLRQGENLILEGQSVTLLSDVPAKHKVALQYIKQGDQVVMYGVLVGEATQPIRMGEVLSTGNVRHSSAEFSLRSERQAWTAPDVSKWKDRTFLGYRRSDGQVGTRNYWLVVPLVFCENKNIHALQKAFEKQLGTPVPEGYDRQVAELVHLYRAGRTEELASYQFQDCPRSQPATAVFPNIDGVKFLTHDMGCGGTREDAQTLCGLIAGYIHHPNVAGATILSLGCQNAQLSILREELHRRNPDFDKPLLVFDQQDRQLESNMLSAAIRQTFLGLVKANDARRTREALAHLTVGLKCGGSDGFSGISANPALGYLTDLLSTLGGKCILAEFPELCGVEQSLIDRCVDAEIGARFVGLMQTYAARAEAVGSGFDRNPSPGNIQDGLITGGMKSAGAARKGGDSPVTDVLDYPEYATQQGLSLLCTPGNDVEAVTAEVGAGANVVLFTTGLGTPVGNPISPVVKVSSNSELARRMHDIIDIDTGSILRAETTPQQMGESILESVIQVASGEVRTKAELRLQEDFIPWKRGVSL